MYQDKQQICIYIHIPFCNERCPYCHFYTVSRRSNLIEEFVLALTKEILSRGQTFQNKVVRSIYFGGGTPSLLSPLQVEKILTAISKVALLMPGIEISLEANPLDVVTADIEKLIKLGVKRISLGVQALNDRDLKLLGRSHTTSDVIEGFAMLRKFHNKGLSTNIDLIFGHEGHNLEAWEESLSTAVSLNPDHISAYSLELHDKTLFGAKAKLGRYKIVDNLNNRQMAHVARKIIVSAGYQHYEVSNFAKSQAESNHNLSIWQGVDYIGFGPSAVGLYDQTIVTVKDNLFDYLNQPEYLVETLANIDLHQAKLLLLTRQTKFLKSTLLQYVPALKLELLLDKMRQLGLLNFDDEQIYYSEQGLDVIDSIQNEFGLITTD